jgi:hypothetical protein
MKSRFVSATISSLALVFFLTLQPAPVGPQNHGHDGRFGLGQIAECRSDGTFKVPGSHVTEKLAGETWDRSVGVNENDRPSTQQEITANAAGNID